MLAVDIFIFSLIRMSTKLEEDLGNVIAYVKALKGELDSLAATIKV